MLKLKHKRIILFLIILFIAAIVTLSAVPKKTEQSSEQGVLRKIDGNSMHPTLKNGQRVLVDYNYYKNHEIKRGDIVVIKFKTRDSEDVKRIIALPNDKIIFGNNSKIYLNGKILEENYIQGASFRKEDLSVLLKQMAYYNGVLPRGYYLILGDNRGASYDSTEYGLILGEHIIGKVVSLNVTE
jgi:signal peptidase I